MNTYQKESLLVIIVLAAILVYSNLPQWLLCYVRQSLYEYPVNALIFNAAVYNDRDNILPDAIADFENFGNDKESKVIIKRLNNDLKIEVNGVAYNTNKINILVNYEDAYSQKIKVDTRSSNFLRDKYFLDYYFNAELPAREGLNMIIIELKDKHNKTKEIKYFLDIQQTKESPENVKGITL